jgi:hypothetical protein
MRWAGHVVSKGERRCVYRVLLGRSEGKRPRGRLGVDGRVILKSIFKKWDGEAWTGLVWLRIGTGGGHL